MSARSEGSGSPPASSLPVLTSRRKRGGPLFLSSSSASDPPACLLGIRSKIIRRVVNQQQQHPGKTTAAGDNAEESEDFDRVFAESIEQLQEFNIRPELARQNASRLEEEQEKDEREKAQERDEELKRNRAKNIEEIRKAWTNVCGQQKSSQDNNADGENVRSKVSELRKKQLKRKQSRSRESEDADYKPREAKRGKKEEPSAPEVISICDSDEDVDDENVKKPGIIKSMFLIRFLSRS